MTRSRKNKSKSSKSSRQWRRIDLHLHTPGSDDYQEPNVSYLDILRQAELRGLDIIAFTDHNTIAGYANMRREIEQLKLLQELGRIEPDEKRRLDDYQRLLKKILVLPGFEVTATFGFHILGIFPADTPVSYLQHLLLTLNIPKELIDKGSANVGATSDVLTVYQVINQAGGLVIAAHANSSKGVMLRGLDFGGQTRIAYTQDPNLHTIEVTDLEKRGRYSSRRFFDGSKPEYPRAMRCIQGSDAHRLLRDPANPKSLGVGDRVTEILLPEVSFAALEKVIKGSDLSLTRPFRGKAEPFDFVQAAREEGVSIVQAFHERVAARGGHFNRILEDVCAMVNTNGGTIYAGVSANPKEAPAGIREPNKSIERLQQALSSRFTPEPDVDIDRLATKGKTVIRITIQPGQDLPYALDNHRIYVRDETDSTLAVRDEIVRLVQKRPDLVRESGIDKKIVRRSPAIPPPAPPPKPQTAQPPTTGVEIIHSEERKGTIYHTLRDLRNGNHIKNVSKSSARKLWHYAISQAEAGKPTPKSIKWQGNMAVLNTRQKDNHKWYDLALRDGENIHIYYGVTDDGLNDTWMALLEQVG